jgi:hypothetical protein
MPIRLLFSHFLKYVAGQCHQVRKREALQYEYSPVKTGGVQEYISTPEGVEFDRPARRSQSLNDTARQGQSYVADIAHAVDMQLYTLFIDVPAVCQSDSKIGAEYIAASFNLLPIEARRLGANTWYSFRPCLINRYPAYSIQEPVNRPARESQCRRGFATNYCNQSPCRLIKVDQKKCKPFDLHLFKNNSFQISSDQRYIAFIHFVRSVRMRYDHFIMVNPKILWRTVKSAVPALIRV